MLANLFDLTCLKMATQSNNIFVTFLFILSLKLSESTNCKGCVQLDSFSFDKVVSKFETSLVKFDVAYPYGEKHEQFVKVSDIVRDIPELLIAEVGIKDYGERDNEDLGQRYGVKSENFPVVQLFNAKSPPITFKGDFSYENLLAFIRGNSNVYIGLPGCLKDFDELASKFASSKKEEERKEMLRTAENLWDNAKGVSNQKSAEVYVKTMRKILEKKDFVESEVKRVENLLKGKITKEKANELEIRLNIIKSFAESNPKDEL